MSKLVLIDQGISNWQTFEHHLLSLRSYALHYVQRFIMLSRCNAITNNHTSRSIWVLSEQKDTASWRQRGMTCCIESPKRKTWVGACHECMWHVYQRNSIKFGRLVSTPTSYISCADAGVYDMSNLHSSFFFKIYAAITLTTALRRHAGVTTCITQWHIASRFAQRCQIAICKNRRIKHSWFWFSMCRNNYWLL